MAKEDYILKQTGEQVQKAIDDALALAPATVETPGLMSAADKEKLNGLPTGANIQSSLGEKVDKETGKGLSTNDYDNSEKSKVASASQDVTDIKAKIPSQATAQNQLADKDFVNSSIATATADFKGTYDSLSELQAVTADNNDYGYVVSTDQSGNTVYSRYKYNGSAWVFEYNLNNSSFTAAEWASIQSQITSALVQKLSALPTNQELGQSLSGKQDIIHDLSTIRSGANAGATAYQKPASGIPASDMESGVIPEDVVKYASQTLTDSQKIQARTNIGAASEEELDAINRGEYVEAWDGVSEPVVADIPSGVQVEYNSQTYTGTLAASNDTLGKIYLVGTGTTDEYNRYRTSRSGVEGSYTYAWVPFGSTQIDLANCATKEELSQLEAKVDGLDGKYTLGPWEVGSISLSGGVIVDYTSTTRIRNEKKTITTAGTYRISCGAGYQFLIYVEGKLTTAEWRGSLTFNFAVGDVYRIALKQVPDGDYSSYTQAQVNELAVSSGIKMEGPSMLNDISTHITNVKQEVANSNGLNRVTISFDGDDNTIVTKKYYGLLPGKDYKIDILNPSVPVTNVSSGSGARFFVGAKKLDNSFVYLIQVNCTSLSTPLADHYDITVPENTAYLLFEIRCDRGSTLQTYISEIEKSTQIDFASFNGLNRIPVNIDGNNSTIVAKRLYGLLPGREYRINISNPDVPVTNVISSTGLRFAVSYRENGALINVVKVDRTSLSTPLADHYDFLFPNTAEYVIIETTCDVGSTLQMYVEQIAENKLVKIVGMGTTGPNGGVTKAGDVYFNTETKLLRRCVVLGSIYETVPYLDGAIYTYNGKLYLWDGTNLVPSSNGGFPGTIYLEKSTYVSTARNYILKNENVGGEDMLLYSKDLGKTWVSAPNTIGAIVFVHWFSDGTCLIAGQHAIFTTKDGETFTQSTVLDENGDSFTPDYRAFYRIGSYNSEYTEIEGKEVLVWSDYGTDNGFVSRIWFSRDNGATVQCICAGGRTYDKNSVLINPRHFHKTYIDNEGILWITTGDFGNQCMIIKGLYTWPTNSWSFEILASGDAWKMSGIWRKGPYLYAITDYTLRNKPVGLMRIPIKSIGDEDSIEYVAIVPDNTNPPISGYYEDANGVRIIFPDGAGYGWLYLALGNYDFTLVNVVTNETVAITSAYGPNYKGELIGYGSVGYTDPEDGRKWNGSMYNLSDAFRVAGISSFAAVGNLRPNITY